MPDLSHVMPNPTIVPILWGHDYVAYPDTAKLIEQMISDLVTGPFMNGMAQYGVRRGSVAPAIIIDDKNPPSTIVYRDRNNYLIDQITRKLVSWIDAGIVPPPSITSDINQLYILIPPSETTPQNYNGSTDPIGNGVQGWHNVGISNTSSPIYYWAIVKTNDCGPPSAGLAFVNSFSQKVCHELAEQLVDRNGTFKEIGDPCVKALEPYRGWNVQKYWSDWDNACISGFRPPPMPRSFQTLEYESIYVLGTDGLLWLEKAPFGSVPPARDRVDIAVFTFQAMDNETVFVLGADGSLWLEHAPFGRGVTSRVQVDSGVQAFKALNPDTVYILGNDGNLWLAQAPFGNVPPPRVQVDSTVKAFDGFNPASCYILGTDGKLWEAHGPFGNVPPARQLGAENVRAFLGVAGYQLVWVLSAGNLFSLPSPFSGTLTASQAIGQDVLAFQPIGSGAQGFFLTGDGVLHQWDGPQGTSIVDSDVMEFSATDSGNILVLKTDGSLWWEQPHGHNPTTKTLIDNSVA
jgi:hypothetical protein